MDNNNKNNQNNNKNKKNVNGLLILVIWAVGLTVVFNYATSLKVTPVDFSMYTLALAFPTLPMPPMPPPFRVIRFINSMNAPMSSTMGRM